MSQPAQHPADPRTEAMRLLARSLPEELSGPLQSHWPRLETRTIRAPETGLVMLRGRMGGDGAPFNLGEATVSRAVIELSTGERGYGQLLGRNRDHAALAATVEALNQRQTDRPDVERLILAPIRRRLTAEAQRQRAETAATKVDFFTLVRAEG
ncbi:MAG: phosphonate C-P lyase system protein PhnG [Rhizobiales bacterium]|nr:phosphonate C-P lyase system protein PhnG [Hyphomicrobiales bacterium]